jgi:hypothetical protein
MPRSTIALRSNEDATYRERLDVADTSAAYDANGRRAKKDYATETTADKDRSSPRRESENNAAKLHAKTARSSEGLKCKYLTAWLMLVSGGDFLIDPAKVRQSVHRQPVFVFFALDVHFHQMLEKPLTDAFRLGTVC